MSPSASLALAFDILAKDKASADLNRVGDSADRTGGKLRGLGSTFSGLGKAMALGAVAAGAGAVALGKGFYDAAIESQKVTKQTEAVLKSMGLEAGVSAKNIGDLAGSMAMATGVDDELIQSGMNTLLTFGNVADSAQEVGGIFDQASAAALDMSVAMGTDMTSSAMMIGKALNDPIDGLSKLARSGIQFTDQQKDQIKTMQEAGDMAGAQAIMLGELNKQFGGSAAAQATAGDKLKVVWGNLQEQIGEKLIPVVESAAEWMADKLPRAFDAAEPYVADAVDWFGDVARAVGDFVRDAAPAVQGFVEDKLNALSDWWDEHGPAIRTAVEGFAADFGTYVLTPLTDVADFIGEELLPALGTFITWIADNEGVLQGLGTLIGVVLVGHYVALAAAAVTSAATQAAAWVTVKAAAVASKAETAAIVALMIADWVLLAGKAVIHAATVAGAWVATTVAGAAASTGTIVATTVQSGAWAGLAVAAETSSARIATAWLGVLGPAAAVVAAAEAINDLTGNKMNPNDLSLWERLDPRKAFKGMTFDVPGVPWFDDGGVMPGPLGVHSLAMVAGGETVVPTHKPGTGLGASMTNHWTIVAPDVENGIGAASRKMRSLALAMEG